MDAWTRSFVSVRRIPRASIRQTPLAPAVAAGAVPRKRWHAPAWRQRWAGREGGADRHAKPSPAPISSAISTRQERRQRVSVGAAVSPCCRARRHMTISPPDSARNSVLFSLDAMKAGSLRRLSVIRQGREGAPSAPKPGAPRPLSFESTIHSAWGAPSQRRGQSDFQLEPNQLYSPRLPRGAQARTRGRLRPGSIRRPAGTSKQEACDVRRHRRRRIILLLLSIVIFAGGSQSTDADNTAKAVLPLRREKKEKEKTSPADERKKKHDRKVATRKRKSLTNRPRPSPRRPNRPNRGHASRPLPKGRAARCPAPPPFSKASAISALARHRRRWRVQESWRPTGVGKVQVTLRPSGRVRARP